MTLHAQSNVKAISNKLQLISFRPLLEAKVLEKEHRPDYNVCQLGSSLTASLSNYNPQRA